jgi:2-dehydropantoate 2-reductase
MRIAVLGGGAVGSYIAALLARHGDDVRLLTRGAHLDAIRTNGLSVETPSESYNVTVNATDDPRALLGSDYAVLTVKGYHLVEIAPAIRPLADSATTIVPLLNGVDIVDRLVELGVPRKQMMEGLITLSVNRSEPGKVELRSPFQRVTLGETNRELSARAVVLGNVLQRAGLATRVSRDIRLDLWRKFAFLTPMAAACALMRAPIGEVLGAPGGRQLVIDALREVIAVGRATGVAWAAEDEMKTLADLESLPVAMKPSFLVDIENGRPTELDTLSGTIVRLGGMHGVETPVHTRVVRELSGGPESTTLSRAAQNPLSLAS